MVLEGLSGPPPLVIRSIVLLLSSARISEPTIEIQANIYGL